MLGILIRTIMETFKNILLTIGAVAVVLFIILLIAGIKVVSTIFVYVIGAIVAIALIGIVIYYVGKKSGKSSNEV